MANESDRAIREEIAQVLDEYGEAIRGDWGSIDGRSERSSIQQMARWVRDPETFPTLIVAARDEVGVCREGFGHWQLYCREPWTECTWWEDQ